LVTSIYKKGPAYKKAGVILSNIVPEAARQGSLFVDSASADDDRLPLMLAIDNINFSLPPAHEPQHDTILRFAAAGTNRGWKMKQDYRSPRYTTKWHEMPAVR